MAKLQDKSYRLTDSRSGESFMLKTGKKGNLTIFDPEKETRRAIKHCPNQKSIFVDEQDKHALVEPIIFRYGQLTVSSRQPLTQQFLDMHPANAANTEGGYGGWFEEVNEEKEAKESIEREELQNDLKYSVRQMAKKKDGIYELSAVVAVILGNVKEASEMGVESLKRVIYNQINDDPYYFADEKGNLTIFEDDGIKRRYMVLTALSDGILRKSPNGRSMLWGKDSSVIVTAPRSIDLTDFFTEFLTTDEGILVGEEIAKRS